MSFLVAWIGGLLLLAASLKVLSTYLEPLSSKEFGTTLLLICLEIVLAIALISGRRNVWIWRMAFSSFVIFSCAALRKAWMRETSCGCFGAVEVNPLVIFAIDVIVVFGLAHCRKSFDHTNRFGLPLSSTMVGVVLCFTALAIASFGQRRFSTWDTEMSWDTGLTSSRTIEVFDPSDWIGKRFAMNVDPLGGKYSLVDGIWDIVLLDQDCARCHALEIDLQTKLLKPYAGSRIVLVGVDEKLHSKVVDQLRDLGCYVAVLQNGKDWFVETPVRVRLIDGIVTRAESVDTWELWVNELQL